MAEGPDLKGGVDAGDWLPRPRNLRNPSLAADEDAFIAGIDISDKSNSARIDGVRLEVVDKSSTAGRRMRDEQIGARPR